VKYLPIAASNFAPLHDWLFKIMLGLSTFLVLLVWALMIWFCVKYRRGSSASRANPPGQNPTPELILSALMFVFGVSVFVFGARDFYHMYRAPKDALEIDVVAKQWMWLFHDERTGDAINVLRVPLGRDVRLVMTSNDVIHSLFIPAFRVKQDILPGRYTSLWFRADRLGTYPLLCTQYCGLEHSEMRARVEVVRPEEYERRAVKVPLTADAEVFFKKGCASCHDGGQEIGPSLKGLFQKSVLLRDGRKVLADENYLRRSIEQPEAEIVDGFPPAMPSYRGQLTEDELRMLIHFIKSEASP
jgi:cytochrome c oxidase subunit 2